MSLLSVNWAMNCFITISALLPGTFILHRGQKGVKYKRWHYPRQSLSRDCSSIPPSLACLQQQPAWVVLWVLCCRSLWLPSAPASTLAPRRPDLQWLRLLAELSSFCPVPRRVDFKFPVRGTGGCSACLGASVGTVDGSSQSITVTTAALQRLGACRRHLLAQPFSRSSGLTASLVLPWGGLSLGTNWPTECAE